MVTAGLLDTQWYALSPEVWGLAEYNILSTYPDAQAKAFRPKAMGEWLKRQG
ncbi:hypothetical protein [Vibrio sp. CB1-14]|uniref:Uncharacterized protein n=1 Tax=Vibrio chaetopteri TaxID=3016528 RepID=A0AAU8BSY7_9VIBR